jgi:hypothetical protein
MILLLVLVSGCAVGRGERATAGTATTAEWDGTAHDAYEPAVATALVFDPPVAAHLPAMELPRGPRASTAFVGFEELQTHFFHIRIDDRQTNDWRERYERRAIIHQTGIRYR